MVSTEEAIRVDSVRPVEAAPAQDDVLAHGGDRVAAALAAHGVQRSSHYLAATFRPFSPPRRRAASAFRRSGRGHRSLRRRRRRPADGFWVAAVTAGPGITNTMTALKNAQLAQSPVVLLGGAAPTLLQGRGALQDIDQRPLVAPHVKVSQAAAGTGIGPPV